MPDAVSGEGNVQVGAVLPGVLPQCGQVLENFVATDFEERANQPDSRSQIARDRNARQASQTSSAQDAMEHRFRLVVGCMGCSDKRGSKISCGLGEKILSQVPCGDFDSLVSVRGLPRYRKPGTDKGNFSMLAKVSNELLVRFAFIATESMIGMRCHEAQPANASQRVE